VLCKDRVFETFRSLYTQRPTQVSVLRRRLVCNAEVAEYAVINGMINRDRNMLAQEVIAERNPEFSAQFVIKSTSTDPDYLHYINRGRNFYSFSTSLFTLFSTFVQDVEVCSCSAEGCRCLINGRGSHVNIECVRIGSLLND
jgi:hypothetical protein